MNLAAAANLAWWAASCPAARRFAAALRRPADAQRQLLDRCLARNAETAFGRRFNFASIRTPDDYARAVPLSRYDDLAGWIGRIAAGERGVLTDEPVSRLVPSAGSSAARKLIPYTRTLHREIARAVGPWVADLFSGDRRIAGGPAYWSVSPAIPPPPIDSAVPVGFESDSDYLGPMLRPLVDCVLAVPPGVARIVDVAEFRRRTADHLAACRELRLISVWHPTFLTLLLDELAERGIHPAQARPRLALVSCWADGPAEPFARDLAARLAGVAVQPKGLIATEGVVSLPWRGQRPAAVRSHYLELLGDDGVARPIATADVGGEYEVVLTTGGGLYRYRPGDRVRVTSRAGETPSLQFIGRADRVVDRFGEKLSEGFVAGVIEQALGRPAFAMLAPDGRGYTLYVQADRLAADLPARLESALRENPHYRYCVDLGQLAPARVFRIERGAAAAYLARCTALGQRLGEIKPTPLHAAGDWSRALRGQYFPPRRRPL